MEKKPKKDRSVWELVDDRREARRLRKQSFGWGLMAVGGFMVTASYIALYSKNMSTFSFWGLALVFGSISCLSVLMIWSSLKRAKELDF